MSMPHVVVSSLPQGTSFSRVILALAQCRGDVMAARAYTERWTSTPQVHATFETWLEKSAVPAGSTTDATWCGPLAPFSISAEAILILRGMSILGALEPKMTKVPIHASIPHETPSAASGAWLAQGQPTPFTKANFESRIQEYYKFGAGSVLTRELIDAAGLATYPLPDAEATVRRVVLGKLAVALDQAFLLPTVAPSSAGPGAITNGATQITSTGSTAAAIATDLGSMVAAMGTPGPFVWIMQPKTMSKIALTVNGPVTADLPRTLAAIPVIASATSPQQITLVDPAAIWLSDAGQFTVEYSDQAVIQQDDAPDNPALATTVMNSLWAENKFGIKALRWLNYQRVEANSVCWMTVAY